MYMTHVNNKGIEQGRAEEHNSVTEESTRSIYAGVALALWNTLDADNEEEKLEMIATVVNESQSLWERFGLSIQEECERVTGLDFQYKEQAE